MSAALTAILAVFTGVSEWFATALSNMIPVFWTAAESGTGGELTIIGSVAVASLAIAIALMLLRYVWNFFTFKQ